MSRISISSKQNIWSDAQSVDDEDLQLEQDHTGQLFSSLIGNHIGTGVLPEALSQPVIFDSSLSGDLLDGKSILPQAQPSDSNNGNQLEIELLGSLVAGKKTIKLVIIGLDFQNSLQYDTFTFARNERQLTKKHYRSILSILINDFIGAPLQSFNLGGRIIVRESTPMTLSRDSIMIAQDVEPNLIFRDFFVASAGTLSNLLATSLPSYNVDTLNIHTGYRQLRGLEENDVSSQIGQKFLASSNNIQKISLLLSVINNSDINNLAWTGDLIVSIYPLQSTVQSSSDIVPNLAIDFDPSPIPLAQISFDYASLLSTGVELTTVPQPVDFIFSNTPVGSGLLIKSGSYYIITVKRSGSADTCEIQLATGNNTSTITRESIFNGSVWVDIQEESLWFRAFTDAAKLSDGQAYDNGIGVQVTKTVLNQSGIAEDYVFDKQPFLRNETYSAVLQAKIEESVKVQNERTGNDINSQKQYVPSISLMTSAQLAAIKSVSDPLILGTITDQNIKTSSVSGSTVSGAIHHYGMSGNEIVIKIIDDSTDGYRYDSDLITMISDLVSGKLNEAKFVPNTSNPTKFYRIVKAELMTLMYGDINGDGIIDNFDLLSAQRLLGTDLNFFPTEAQYLVHRQVFTAEGSLIWQIISPGSIVVASGANGILTPTPGDGTTSNFTSASGNFNSLPPLSGYRLVISGSLATANNGSFKIDSLFDNTTIVISKLIYSSNTFIDCLRADINGDMVVGTDDVGLITDYINLLAPFPPTSSPSNKIGKTFTAVRFTVDQYINRSDDYPNNDSNRSTTLHRAPDIYQDGYSIWAGQNVTTSPIQFSIVKQLNWKEHNIVVNSHPKMVPASFNFNSGGQSPLPSGNLNTYRDFPNAGTFDTGRNDLFVPNNLIVNTGGQLTTPNGSYYKVDFEVGTVSFEIPAVQTFGGEKTVNLLTDFISDFTGMGHTRLGYPALRFADGSPVSMAAFTRNQVRINVGIQSVSPQLNGVTPEAYEGIIVDNRIGVSIDYSTGLLTLQFNNLYKDPTQSTINTKVQITFFLKRAGFLNAPIFIGDNKTANLLGI